MKVKVKVKRPTAIKIGTHSVSGKAFVSDNSVTTQKLVDGAVTEEKLASNLKEKLNNKQDKLTFDDEPTADSTNPVTSGGVKSALDGKADKQTANGGFNAGLNSVAGLDGVSIGNGASCGDGVSIGRNAASHNSGVAIGIDTSCGKGVVIGNEAKINNDTLECIQIGAGTNNNEFSMQVYDYQLLADDAETPSATDNSKYLKDIGKLSKLTTTVKNSIVDAINSIVTLLKNKADKYTEDGGFVAGEGASNYVSNAKSGIAIGKTAESENGGVSIGYNSWTGQGVSIGYNSGGNGVTIGKNASAYTEAGEPIDAVQLGSGTNSNKYTAQIYDYPLIANDAETPSAIDGSKYLKDVGKLSSLATSVKDNIVNAVNSLVAAHNDLKLKSVPHKDVSGYPVTFADHLADEEFIKCNVYGSTEGIGNLDSSDGKYKIPVTLTGKNVLPYPYKDPSKAGNGISFTVNGDGSVSLTGTATGKATYYFARSFKLKSGTYTLSEKMKNQSSNVSIILDAYAGGKFLNSYSASAKKTTVITLSQDATVSIYAYVPTGVVCENYPVKPQLEIGTAETEYEPYTANSVTAALDTALGEGEYIDIINKKRYGTDGSATDITVSGSLKTIDSAKNHISCGTTETPSKIELSYWQDINKVLSETTNAILAQGGDV